MTTCATNIIACFGIDQATGQIKTNEVALDYDAIVAATTSTIPTAGAMGTDHQPPVGRPTRLVDPLMVRATDSAGDNTGEAGEADDPPRPI